MAGLISLALTWWAGPLDTAGGRMGLFVFAVRGVVPVGYALFAFLSGVTVGFLLRRTVPAMAVTLVVVAAALAAAPLLRGHLAVPTTYRAVVQAESIGEIRIRPDAAGGHIWITVSVPLAGSWVLSNDVFTSTGAPFDGPYDKTKCGPDATGSRKDCTESIAAQHLQQRIVYMSAGKFWTLQWRELGVFLVASALLGIFCFWWIRRRVA